MAMDGFNVTFQALETKRIQLFFPSFTKSEAMEILMVLIVTPYNSCCSIYTDSNNCINTLQSLLHTPTSPCRQPKQKTWAVKIRNLHVKMIKVKAYTNDKFNEYAGQLTKAGANIKDPIVINYKFFSDSSLGLIKWRDLYAVDQILEVGVITPYEQKIFDSLVNNKSLNPLNNISSMVV
ncbi:hypothetical protein RhiirA1_451592 [Rhizophagus irregularis]|uniref:RNase H type-1 domain-containing protein n=2 Tax=Rhizophagus irregularis TaxID=588596 RepID=A0A2N0SBZ2_9GLOM|nr:hypothetical protein RirG_260360 [Rhizophagus irregularis DAOM 197198w]PKC73076.1 hypothetical protein RhiirA1_451592 [Rhizophagus irregularis]